jgi:hypothetical protein
MQGLGGPRNLSRAYELLKWSPHLTTTVSNAQNHTPREGSRDPALAVLSKSHARAGFSFWRKTCRGFLLRPERD